MLKTMIVMLGLSCSVAMMANHANAHGAGGHGAQVKAEDVVDLASSYVISLIKHKKEIEGKVLDASWLKVAETDKAIASQKSWYYVVSIHHSAQKRTLYLMISKKGKLYRVNYSGKFKDFE
ncbi:MAG: DUF6488 family protein [Ghiorsea sp.]